MSDTENFPAAGGGVWIGVDIGGTKTAVVLSSEPPKILARIEFPTLPEQGPNRALDLIKSAIKELIRRRGPEAPELAAIGISCGGPLDRIAGVIQSPPNLPTWTDVPIVSLLQSEFGVDCRMENDANAGAVAEHRFGAGVGTRHMVFLTMGTGLGAGIIVDGRLYRGASDTAGEIGHVRLTSSGPVGYNKAGSVEGWASGGGMAQAACEQVAAAIRNGEPSLLVETFLTNQVVTAKDVAAAAAQGDAVANRIVESTGVRLGESLAIVADILNPELIVIGGLAMRFGDSLWTPARLTLAREALPPAVAACRIVPAALGEQIGDIAAICVAMGC